MSCADFRGQSASFLTQLADELYHGRYQPLAPRWVDVPKHDKPGATRRLGILAVRDRVVHAALKQVLEPILEPTFLPSSFGFRPGHCVPGALAAAVHAMNPPVGAPLPFPYAVHLDIADCFDTVDHQLLMERLALHVADEAFLRLTEKILHAGGCVITRLWWRRSRGLVQGSPLSPLLCNLYLHRLDQELADLTQTTHHGVKAFRYADDLLLLARDPQIGRRTIVSIRRLLDQLRQRLRNPHAFPVAIHEGIDWLGVRLQPRPRSWIAVTTFGYIIPDAKVVEMLHRIDEMTQRPCELIQAAAFNPARWILSINEQLRSWRQAYLFADNSKDVFQAIDDHCRVRVGQLLQAITNTPKRYLAQFRVRLPRGFWTWEVPGARLVILSSLAPHCPSHLTRRPAWMRYRPNSSKSSCAPQRAHQELTPNPDSTPSPTTTNDETKSVDRQIPVEE